MIIMLNRRPTARRLTFTRIQNAAAEAAFTFSYSAPKTALGAAALGVYGVQRGVVKAGSYTFNKVYELARQKLVQEGEQLTPQVEKQLRKAIKTTMNKKRKRTTGTTKSRKKTKKTQPKATVDKMQNKQIRNIQKQLKTDTSTKIRRGVVYDSILTSRNQSQFFALPLFTKNDYEAAITNLKYFDPSNPGTLLTANGNTGTYQRNFNFVKGYAKINLRNNYEVPVRVRLYHLRCAEDTTINPQTRFTQGLADVGITNANGINVYPTDSHEFMNSWPIVTSKMRTLTPGKTVSMIATFKDVHFNPADLDERNLTYQRGFKTQAFGIRIVGVQGHAQVGDPSVDQHGSTQCGVDYELVSTLECKYDGGNDHIDIEVSQDSTLTAPGYVSAAPNALNRTFSYT